jgi:phenylacetate-coenzyme A ligase PaaK-like adenylate-forming protein
MLKIKGVNFWPAGADDVILADKRVSEYRGTVMLDAQAREVASVELEWDEGATGEDRAAALVEIADRLHQATGIRFSVEPASESLPRFADDRHKPRRWRDERFDQR